MKRGLCVLLGLGLASIPSETGALQLRWSHGNTDLSFQVATRCTLVVEAAPTASLPSEWRLVWCAEGATVLPVARDPASACDGDTARVASFDGYSAPDDSTAALATARFCSGSAGAGAAVYVLDLPAGSRGKLRAVALDPSDPDSERVVQSNDATFNGGVGDPYPAVILRSTTEHASVPFSVTAIGAGLGAATAVTMADRAATWSAPLSLVERSDTRLTATAEIAEALPPSAVRISAGAGGNATILLPPDPVSGPDLSFLKYIPVYTDPNPSVIAKDFAFIYNTVPHPVYGWHGVFHLFYIRHFTGGDPAADNETTFGHAWYRPWASGYLWWQTDTVAFSCSGVGWDAKQVWAPSIISQGDRSYMFYTGVDDSGNQRIGFASTSLIDTSDTRWTRESSPVFTADMTQWADKGAPQQFRDPFVIGDPNNPGQYLMLYAGLNKLDGHNAVGIAQSDSGSLTSWRDRGYYRGTDFSHNGGAYRIESPHLLPDSASAELGNLDAATWRLFYTDGPAGPYTAVQFEQKRSTATPLTDTTAASWAYPATYLYAYLNYDIGVNGWYASEWLKAGSVSFLAADHSGRIEIKRLTWTGTDFTETTPYIAAVDDGAKRVPAEVGFRLAALVPGQGRATFRIEMPWPARGQVVVYDVMGRRIRTAFDAALPAGRSDVSWDGRDGAGAAVGSGMYFVRLSTGSARQVVRVPLIR